MLDVIPNPVAIQIGPIPVYWYGIGYAVGLAAAYIVLTRIGRRAGEDDELAYWVGPAPAVAGLVSGATFGVSLVDVEGSATDTEPVLGGSL